MENLAAFRKVQSHYSGGANCGRHCFSGQSLLLSTIILNDIHIYTYTYIHTYICIYIYIYIYMYIIYKKFNI